MALMALDDDNVRTTRGDVPMDSDELASQPTPPASSSMLGYVAKGIQDFLGATPSIRDKETADASMETQVALEQQVQGPRAVEATVHEDTPFQSVAPSVSNERQVWVLDLLARSIRR